MGMFLGINHDHPVLVEQCLIAFNLNTETLTIVKTNPGCSVGQRVGTHANGRVQRCAHAGTRFKVPGTAGCLNVHWNQGPQLQFFLMGTAVITSGHKL